MCHASEINVPSLHLGFQIDMITPEGRIKNLCTKISFCVLLSPSSARTDNRGGQQLAETDQKQLSTDHMRKIERLTEKILFHFHSYNVTHRCHYIITLIIQMTLVFPAGTLVEFDLAS